MIVEGRACDFCRSFSRDVATTPGSTGSSRLLMEGMLINHDAPMGASAQAGRHRSWCPSLTMGQGVILAEDYVMGPWPERRRLSSVYGDLSAARRNNHAPLVETDMARVSVGRGVRFVTPGVPAGSTGNRASRGVWKSYNPPSGVRVLTESSVEEL